MEPTLDTIMTWPQGLHLDLFRASLLEGEECSLSFHRWSASVAFDDLDHASIGLMPLLRWNLKRQGIRHHLLPRIESVGRYLLVETMMRLGALGALVSSLNKHEIPFLTLFGGVNGSQFYPQSSLRPMDRCGLMIRDADRDRVRKVLIPWGWTFVARENQKGNDADLIHRCEFPKISILLYSNDRGRLGGERGNRVWEDAREILFQENRFRALSPCDEFVEACREGYRQGSKLSSMLWLADCAMILRSGAIPTDHHGFELGFSDPSDAHLVTQCRAWILAQ